MDNSALLAAYQLITLVGIGATIVGVIVGLPLGYAWGRRTVCNKPLVTGLTFDRVPVDNPLTWDHLPVPAEPEQAL